MVRYYYISIVALLNNKAYIIILNNVYLQPIHKNISCILLSVQDDRVTARFSGLLIICLLKLSFSELSDFLKSCIVLTFHCFKIYCLCVWRSYTFYLLLRAFLFFTCLLLLAIARIFSQPMIIFTTRPTFESDKKLHMFADSRVIQFASFTSRSEEECLADDNIKHCYWDSGFQRKWKFPHA